MLFKEKRLEWLMEAERKYQNLIKTYYELLEMIEEIVFSEGSKIQLVYIDKTKIEKLFGLSDYLESDLCILLDSQGYKKDLIKETQIFEEGKCITIIYKWKNTVKSFEPCFIENNGYIIII